MSSGGGHVAALDPDHLVGVLAEVRPSTDVTAGELGDLLPDRAVQQDRVARLALEGGDRGDVPLRAQAATRRRIASGSTSG